MLAGLVNTTLVAEPFVFPEIYNVSFESTVMLSIYAWPEGLGANLPFHNKLPLEFNLRTTPPPDVNDNIVNIGTVAISPELRMTVNVVDEVFIPT